MCLESTSVFAAPWWLDATAGMGNWGLCEVKQNGTLIASMPWVLKRRFGLGSFSTKSYPNSWALDRRSSHGTKIAKQLADRRI